ncbi:MAG TPA: hypothetical protein VFZ48_04255 [Candidatus Saccharimonadales bacterium]
MSAGPVVGFKPGRIIDDSIFSNVNTMSAGQIQGFLNSKVPTCDTQGTQPSEFGGGTRAQYGRANGNPPPFICLKDYRENNKPAAQIIREVAVQYQINPQVLIVLLQKEQGLVTDTWPWKSQYRSATGYGCPDTAPCDRDYYGFTNQVRWAAKMFRAILNDDPEWYTRYNVGANRIQYNPNSSCGSSMVNVENRATAALYNYTPYQPNAAALQAGYGQGNSCSAYGNRNFYLYFTDWFGATTTLFTPFFTITGRDGIFITGANNSYYQVRSTAQLKDYGYGSRFHRLDNITSAAANNRTFKGYLPTVARFEGDAIYVINEARKHQFTSASQYSAYGFSMGQEATLPETLAPNYALSANMQSVLTQSDRQEIYFIEGGKKRHISSREAYQTMGSPTYASLPTVELSSRFAASMSDGRPIVVASSLVESYDTDDFHWWNGSQRQAVANTLVLGAEKTSDYAAPANVVEQLPASSSPTITAYVKDSSNNYFLISAKHKIALDSAAMTKLGVPTGSYTLTDGAFLALFPTVNPTALPVRVNNGTKVYLYKNNVFRHIYSKEDLESYGFNLDQTITLTTDAAKLYSISSEPLLAEGKLIQIGSGDDIYMISNESKHKLPSPSFFALFGRNTREIRSVPASVAIQYTTGQPLSYWHKGVDGKAWLFQNGRRYLASTTMLSAAHYDKPSASLQALSNPVIGKVPSGQDLAELLRFGTEDTVYAIRDGKKSVVTSRDAFTREFGDQKWSHILSVGQDMLRRIPNGPPIQ